MKSDKRGRSSVNTDDSQLPDLPVTDILDELKAALVSHHQAVLQAPPGAGKTTLVPVALAGEPWLGHRKILILEPRRIATRAAAQRMAELLGESPGQTVGYRMRLDTRVSAATKIEVITEGILTRMLQTDPSLDDVGLLIFDEFHERSLDADLALALALKGRELFRTDDPLKLLVMSATLDVDRIAAMIDAPLIRSEGRQYPVDIHYGRASQPRDRIDDRVVAAVRDALKAHPTSSLLVFLPGEGEIRRIERGILDQLAGALLQDVDVLPLFGSLSIEDQRAAITPAGDGSRKVVLATNVAETSLTIDGVDVVIDAGLVREPAFDPNTGMTRLETRRISDASSTQRAGRAGRLAPGHCYRLWSADQQNQLALHATPEIVEADLAPLGLTLFAWGVNDPGDLAWLDAPPAGAWQQALSLLDVLGAIAFEPLAESGEWRLTPHGIQMASLPVHPRLAHMLIRGAGVGHARKASMLAAVFSDRDPFSRETPDMADRLDVLEGRERCPDRYRGWRHRTLELAARFESMLDVELVNTDVSVEDDAVLGFLLATAYPERIARRRHSGGFQLANGRGAEIDVHSPLSRAPWLAVAEVSGMSGRRSDVIRSAAILKASQFEQELVELVREETVVEWEARSGRFIAEQRRQIGNLVLERRKLQQVPAAAKSQRLLAFFREQGMALLNWTTELRQWQARVDLIRNQLPEEDWPAISDEALLESLETWLAPYLDQVKRQADFKKLDLKVILQSMLNWDQQQRVNELAPERIQVPSGSSHRIDYLAAPPVLAVKLQEMFGCTTTPRILQGKIPLMIHLLSPAGRPLQITQDLASFWGNSYEDVKKEMKGRYPKHPWPDDPLVAIPTAKTRHKT